jgi:galactokinase
LLRDGDLIAAGPQLTASHESLRDDFEVSWAAADVTVEVAIAAGACGARMTGGGFGGSVIALVAAERDEAVREAVAAAYEQRGWPGPRFRDAVPSAGARRVR